MNENNAEKQKGQEEEQEKEATSDMSSPALWPPQKPRGRHVAVGAEGTARKAIHLRRHAARWITSSKLTNAPEQPGI